jgi:hypothetical protein
MRALGLFITSIIRDFNESGQYRNAIASGRPRNKSNPTLSRYGTDPTHPREGSPRRLPSPR